MESNNAVNSSQLSEQMDTAIPNEVHTVISTDPGRSADILEVPNADQTAPPAEDTTPSGEPVTVRPDPLGLLELWSGGKCRIPCATRSSGSSTRSMTTWV